MSNDNTNNDLEQAVRDFREIEGMLQQLAEQTQLVNGAGEQLEVARNALQQLQMPLTRSVQQHTELAGDLAKATQVIRELDPSSIFSQLERLTGDVERQGDRLSETTGELRARIDAHELASEQRTAALDRRLWRAAMLSALLSAAAVLMIAINLATGQ